MSCTCVTLVVSRKCKLKVLLLLHNRRYNVMFHSKLRVAVGPSPHEDYNVNTHRPDAEPFPMVMRTVHCTLARRARDWEGGVLVRRAF